MPICKTYVPIDGRFHDPAPLTRAECTWIKTPTVEWNTIIEATITIPKEYSISWIDADPTRDIRTQPHEPALDHTQWNEAIEAAARALEKAIGKGVFIDKLPDHIRDIAKKGPGQ